MSNRYTELMTQLRSLKLPTIAESFSEIAVKAVRSGLSIVPARTGAAGVRST